MDSHSTMLLTQSEERAVLDMKADVAAVEEAFRSHGRQEAVMPPKVYLPIERYGGDFRAMPGFLGRAAGVKWISSFPNNPVQNRLPAVIGLFVLSHPATARPLAVMDATALTGFRTGAAAAVATKHLRASAPKRIGLIGAGAQAATILEAHRVVFGDSLEAVVADVSRPNAESFAMQHDATPGSLEDASGCDVVCTATPSRQPIVVREWVQKGAHINAMGADAPGKQELDPQLLREAFLVVDDVHQATASGEVNVPLRDGMLSEEEIDATLGEIVAGRRAAPRGATLTIFDSTGLAIQDVALAKAAYDIARERRMGLRIDFSH